MQLALHLSLATGWRDQPLSSMLSFCISLLSSSLPGTHYYTTSIPSGLLAVIYYFYVSIAQIFSSSFGKDGCPGRALQGLQSQPWRYTSRCRSSGRRISSINGVLEF